MGLYKSLTYKIKTVLKFQTKRKTIRTSKTMKAMILILQTRMLALKMIFLLGNLVLKTRKNSSPSARTIPKMRPHLFRDIVTDTIFSSTKDKDKQEDKSII